MSSFIGSFNRSQQYILVIALVVVLTILAFAAWLYAHNALTWQPSRIVERIENIRIDRRDWLEAKKADTADSYAVYLHAHDDGAFVTEARAAARRFLTVKYTEMPTNGQVLITDGAENRAILAATSPTSRGSWGFKRVEEHRVAICVGYGEEFTLERSNAIFRSRVPCASIIPNYDDKGVLMSGFDIYLQGNSQKAAVYQLNAAARDKLLNSPKYPCEGKALESWSAAGGEIFDAAESGDAERVSRLVGGNPSAVLNKDDRGMTPLHWAVAENHSAVAELLVADKALVEATDNLGRTPLHWAALLGNKEVAELLLSSKAKVNAIDNDGRTPFSLATNEG